VAKEFLASTGECLSDLDLLRRYEPVIHFTYGEEYFPSGVDHYVKQCGLWVYQPDGRHELLVERGKLSLDELAKPRVASFGATHHLKFSDALPPTEVAAFYLQEKRQLRKTGALRPKLGRLARVGYGSRLLAALFSLTLLLRGRIPGDMAAAASLASHSMQIWDEPGVYYGRVVRENGWTVLQYWFFYHFNNWRSGFSGLNDHEADWEMITLYLSEEDGQLKPQWAAYASHDYHGDDLRRRWDDREELELQGDRPVVYAAAGSHASYFKSGDYLAEIEISFLAPLTLIIHWLYGFWTRTLRQAGIQGKRKPLNLFSIPFVDYARGDGVSFGPGQDHEWRPVLLDPAPAWVSQYRGLWGWHAHDLLGGENAPAGPMYNRDGSVRHAWYDPLGWAGLDKVPPPAQERTVLEQRKVALLARQQELDLKISTLSRDLQTMGEELAALRSGPHLATLYAEQEESLEDVAAAVQVLRKERAENVVLIEALEQRIAQLAGGERDDPRAHIHRRAEPAPLEGLRLNRWASIWAAMSSGLILICLVVLLIWGRHHLVLGLIAVAGALASIEAIFQRRVVQLVTGITILLAILSAGVLIFQFFWQIVASVVVLTALYLIWQNVRELRR